MKKKEANEIRERNSLSIPIVPESAEAVLAAKNESFGDALKQEQTVRQEQTVHALPLFATASTKRQHTSSNKASIMQQILVNTRRKTDPFLASSSFGGPTKQPPTNSVKFAVKHKAPPS